MIDKRVSMKSKLRSECMGCGKKIKIGQPILWNPENRRSWHIWCKDKTYKFRPNALVATRPPRGSVRHFTF